MPILRAILAPLAWMPALSPARPIRAQKALAPVTPGDKRPDMWPRLGFRNQGTKFRS